MENITIRYRNENGKFNMDCADGEQECKDTNAVIELLTSGRSRYPDVIEIKGFVDIDVIREKLGHTVVSEDAIIFLRGNIHEEQWVRIFPNMDALMTIDENDNYPDWDMPTIELDLRELCNFEGPLDTDRLFSVDGFMSAWDGEFDGCEKLDVNINYDTVEFGESDDHRYVFMNSKINPPIDKWKVDERAFTLDSWFANSEFNQPLNNWKLTKLYDIPCIFFRSKYNLPLDKWFSRPITVNAVLAFAESECHQDLSMWKINPDSQCDGMFYKSKYTIEEVSQWSWVRGLNQPIEELFELTSTAQHLYHYVLDAIKD